MRMNGRHDDVVRITGARSSLTDDVRGRQRRYVISMLVRTVCVILAVTLWHVNVWLAWIALAGAALLPYIAVVIANGGRENARNLPAPFVGQSAPPAIEGRVERLEAHRPGAGSGRV